MKKVEVSAMVPAKGDQAQLGPITVQVNFPETLKEATELYGEEAILTNALAAWKITLQAAIRSGLKRGLSQAELQAKLENAKMGVALERAKVDPEAVFKSKFLAATPEQRKKMIEELIKAAQV